MKREAIAPIETLRGYNRLLTDVAQIVQAGRRQAAWTVNTIMSAVYWEMGRRIVEFEQRGRPTAEYGERVILMLARDLNGRFGRGFKKSNLYQFRAFYLAYPQIFQSLLGKSSQGLKTKGRPGNKASDLAAGAKFQSPLGKSLAERLATLTEAFPLPWTHYFRLLSLKSEHARRFYEKEALRGGWSSRQLDRQIATQLYERTGLSRDKTAMLRGAQKAEAGDAVTLEEEIRSPYLLEFLGLKTNTPRAISRRRSSSISSNFSSNSGAALPSSRGNGDCGSAMSGIGSTFFSFTAACAASC